MVKRRFVAKGVPGGWRVWDNRTQSYWGELYEVQPDDLVKELNGKRRAETLNNLSDHYRKQKR